MTIPAGRTGMSPPPGATQRPWDHQRDPFVQTQVRPIGQPLSYRTARPAAAHQPAAPMHAPTSPWAYPPVCPPAPPSGRPTRSWAPIAAGAALVVAVAVVGLVAVLVIAGGASRKSSTETGGGSATVAAPGTPTASPPAIIAVDGLPGLLLDPATINRLVGASDMGVEPGDPALPYTAGPIDHPECAGIWHPAERTTLQGSGWVALQANSFREHVGAWNHLAAQAVVAYPNAEAAAAFAGSQATTWTKCSGRLLTETPKDSAPNLWTVGPVTNREGMLSVRFMQEGTGGWGCQRA